MRDFACLLIVLGTKCQYCFPADTDHVRLHRTLLLRPEWPGDSSGARLTQLRLPLLLQRRLLS
jgi:hypothetical protein